MGCPRVNTREIHELASDPADHPDVVSYPEVSALDLNKLSLRIETGAPINNAVRPRLHRHVGDVRREIVTQLFFNTGRSLAMDAVLTHHAFCAHCIESIQDSQLPDHNIADSERVRVRADQGHNPRHFVGHL